MKLASYIGTQDGWRGLGNRAIRLRLRGTASHSEVVFLPGDGVDHLMPDGTCEPIDGMYWSGSSVAAERLPPWSRRAGKIGGVRMKRIAHDPAKWELDDYRRDPITAAQWFIDHDGDLYDWQLIFGFLAWPIPNKKGRFMCSGAVAAAGEYPDAHRFEPCLLKAVTIGNNQFYLSKAYSGAFLI